MNRLQTRAIRGEIFKNERECQLFSMNCHSLLVTYFKYLLNDFFLFLLPAKRRQEGESCTMIPQIMYDDSSSRLRQEANLFTNTRFA